LIGSGNDSLPQDLLGRLTGGWQSGLPRAHLIAELFEIQLAILPTIEYLRLQASGSLPQ
jgi:hypothetical protein